MDWARAIEINHTALTRIVAGLITMVGLVGDGVVTRLSRPTYRAVLLVLRPAEAAVRRLIVIAALGLVAKPLAYRPMPKGLAIAGKRGGVCRFNSSTRESASSPGGPSATPAMTGRSSGRSPTRRHLSPIFRPEDFGRPVPEKDDSVDASRLSRRLLAIKQALETCPAKPSAWYAGKPGARR